MARYKAVQPGYIPELGFIEEGREFVTDRPKGTWMEEISTGKPEGEAAEGPETEVSDKGKGKGKAGK